VAWHAWRCHTSGDQGRESFFDNGSFYLGFPFSAEFGFAGVLAVPLGGHRAFFPSQLNSKVAIDDVDDLPIFLDLSAPAA
jgi:hypothetical protein